MRKGLLITAIGLLAFVASSSQASAAFIPMKPVKALVKERARDYERYGYVVTYRSVNCSRRSKVKIVCSVAINQQDFDSNPNCRLGYSGLYYRYRYREVTRVNWLLKRWYLLERGFRFNPGYVSCY